MTWHMWLLIRWGRLRCPFSPPMTLISNLSCGGGGDGQMHSLKTPWPFGPRDLIKSRGLRLIPPFTHLGSETCRSAAPFSITTRLNHLRSKNRLAQLFKTTLGSPPGGRLRRLYDDASQIAFSRKANIASVMFENQFSSGISRRLAAPLLYALKLHQQSLPQTKPV